MLKFVAMGMYKKYQDGGGYDPTASIISGVGTGLGAIAGFFGTGKKAQQEQRDLAGAAASDIESFYKKAAAGDYDYSADFTIDPAYSDIYELSKTKTSTDPLLRAGATGLSALQQSGTRGLLAGLNPLMQGIAQQEAQMGLADIQREMAGLQTLGAARTEADLRNKQLQLQNQQFMRDLGMRQLGQAELAQSQAEENIQAMKRARAQAFGGLLGGVGSALTAGIMKDGGKVPEENKYSEGGSFPDLSGDGKVTKKDVLIGRGVIPKAENGMKYQMGGNVLAQIMGAQGGQPPVQGPLPGEASHETNPIDMIDKNGEKVGEAMGGEFIINDKQADLILEEYKSIEKAIKDGREPTKDELMALYEASRKVFGQPQFQEEAEEAEMEMS